LVKKLAQLKAMSIRHSDDPYKPILAKIEKKRLAKRILVDPRASNIDPKVSVQQSTLEQ
jgi:hypothetical protein